MNVLLQEPQIPRVFRVGPLCPGPGPSARAVSPPVQAAPSQGERQPVLLFFCGGWPGTEPRDQINHRNPPGARFGNHRSSPSIFSTIFFHQRRQVTARRHSRTFKPSRRQAIWQPSSLVGRHQVRLLAPSRLQVRLLHLHQGCFIGAHSAVLARIVGISGQASPATCSEQLGRLASPQYRCCQVGGDVSAGFWPAGPHAAFAARPAATCSGVHAAARRGAGHGGSRSLLSGGG
jgi:hypothetical protein